MKLEKIKKTFGDYKLELSWGQIESIAAALEQNHADPLADELYAEWKWYMGEVPGPGEDEEAADAEKKGLGAEGGEDDFPLPMPPGGKLGVHPNIPKVEPSPEEDLGVEDLGDEGEGGAELPEPEAETEEPAEEGPEAEFPEDADERLPKPPRE